MTSFLWKKVPESNACSVTHTQKQKQQQQEPQQKMHIIASEKKALFGITQEDDEMQ